MATIIEQSECNHNLDLSVSTSSIHPPYSIEPSAYAWAKQWFERLLAMLLLIPGLLMIGCLIVLVRLTSRGSGIYRQTRVGKDGKAFDIFKIRTMTDDAEARTGPAWSLRNDPRVTPIGRVIRRLHLDELPQLLNVVRGEMLLIGPRPERPEFVRVLVQEIPDFADRLCVFPGITGLAQINLEPDVDLDSVRRKVMLDREYIQRMNCWLDIRIFLCTFLHFVGLPGPWARSLMCVHRDPVLDSNGTADCAVLAELDADAVLTDTVCSRAGETDVKIPHIYDEQRPHS